MSTRTDSVPVDMQQAAGPRVVVAIGGSSTGAAAARWAAVEAARLRLPLQVVGAVTVQPNPAPLRPVNQFDMTRAAEETERDLTSVAEPLHELAQVLPVVVHTGPPTSAVLDLVDLVDLDTATLVLGHRAQNATQRIVGGSTSTAIAGRSPVPVVVVPDDWQDAGDPRRPIVVGLSLTPDGDGYRTDDEVLAAAFHRARALDAPLAVVHAWQIPALLSWSPSDIAGLRRRVETALEGVLAPWRTRFPEVEVSISAVAGRSTDVVEDGSRVAQLVIVGRHTPAQRHGGFHLGSTARGLLHHTSAPVLVIPVADSARPARPERDAGWGPMF